MAATRRRSGSDQAAGLFPQTMSVMGNRWGFALLVAAFVGISRFTDFQTQLGAPPGSIADRLSIFTANGVFEMSDNRYRLTEKGRALFPVSGDRAPMGAAVVPGTRRAGGDPHPHGVRAAHSSAVLTCDQCSEPLRGAQSAGAETELALHFAPEARTKVQFRSAKICRKNSGTLRMRVLISQVHSDWSPARVAGPE